MNFIFDLDLGGRSALNCLMFRYGLNSLKLVLYLV